MWLYVIHWKKKCVVKSNVNILKQDRNKLPMVHNGHDIIHSQITKISRHLKVVSATKSKRKLKIPQGLKFFITDVDECTFIVEDNSIDKPLCQQPVLNFITLCYM